MSAQEPTEEELRAAMEEQLRQIRVEDVVLQTVATLVNLAGRRLGLAPGTEDERDLEQARLAIEATRALVPLVTEQEAVAVKQALTQLQMAYAREAQGEPGQEAAPAPAQPSPGQEPPDRAAEPPTDAPDVGERAKARSRIWTPPGA